MDSLVSIIIPVYQVETTVAACLDSVLGQTYSNLDVVVVDDGSTDGSRAVCERYAKKDSRIRIVEQENRGLAAARNLGLDTAQGDLLTFLDSDDLIAPNHIELLASLIWETGCDIAVTGLTEFQDAFEGGQAGEVFERYSAEDATEILFYQGVFDTCAPAKLYKATLWNGIRFPEGYIHEDLPTTYKVLLRAKEICYVESSTYGYRFNPDGLNHSLTNSTKVKTFDLVMPIIDEMDNHHPTLVPAARCFCISFCFHLLLNARPDSISSDERNRLMTAIRANRLAVISDKNARTKTRLACILSFGGFGFLGRVFRMLGARA